MTEDPYPTEEDAPADWLDAWSVPTADPAFRERLRAAFLARSATRNETRNETRRGRPHAHDDRTLAELEGELAPHLAALGAPPARPAFARSLRAEFVTGAAEVRLARPVPSSAGRTSLRWRLVVGGLAAAAAWVLLVRPALRESEPEGLGDVALSVPSTASQERLAAQPAVRPAALRVVPGSYSAASAISIDGAPVADLDVTAIDARLSSARAVSTGATAARFRIDDYFVVELDANSHMEWAAEESRAGGARTFVLRSERGALRVATGPAFTGSRMLVEAPFLEVEVVGTVFGVDVYDGIATCLCCAEGTVELRPTFAGYESQRIEGGRTSLVSKDSARVKDIPAAHAEPLDQLALFWRE